METPDPATIDDPETVIMTIRGLQASLTDLQRQVIQGQMTPADYMAAEKARVATIHQLEQRLAVLTGHAPPERETDHA